MTPNLHVRQFSSQFKPSSPASSCITKKLIYLRSYFLLFRVIKVNVSDKYIEPVIRLIYINIGIVLVTGVVIFMFLTSEEKKYEKEKNRHN